MLPGDDRGQSPPTPDPQALTDAGEPGGAGGAERISATRWAGRAIGTAAIAAGAAKGAATGAAIGTVIPVLGTAAGAIAGGVVGGVVGAGSGRLLTQFGARTAPKLAAGLARLLPRSMFAREAALWLTAAATDLDHGIMEADHYLALGIGNSLIDGVVGSIDVGIAAATIGVPEGDALRALGGRLAEASRASVVGRAIADGPRGILDHFRDGVADPSAVHGYLAMGRATRSRTLAQAALQGVAGTAARAAAPTGSATVRQVAAQGGRQATAPARRVGAALQQTGAAAVVRGKDVALAPITVLGKVGSAARRGLRALHDFRNRVIGRAGIGPGRASTRAAAPRTARVAPRGAATLGTRIRGQLRPGSALRVTAARAAHNALAAASLAAQIALVALQFMAQGATVMAAIGMDGRRMPPARIGDSYRLWRQQVRAAEGPEIRPVGRRAAGSEASPAATIRHEIAHQDEMRSWRERIAAESRRAVSEGRGRRGARDQGQGIGD